jgi:hypothetical protein
LRTENDGIVDRARNDIHDIDLEIWRANCSIEIRFIGLTTLLVVVTQSNFSRKEQHSMLSKLEIPRLSRSAWWIYMVAATIGIMSSILLLGFRYSFWKGPSASHPMRALMVLCLSLLLVWFSSIGRLKDMNGTSSGRLLTRIAPIDAAIMGFISSKHRVNSGAGIGITKEATIFTFGFLFMEILCLVLLIMFSS